MPEGILVLQVLTVLLFSHVEYIYGLENLMAHRDLETPLSKNCLRVMSLVWPFARTGTPFERFLLDNTTNMCVAGTLNGI